MDRSESDRDEARYLLSAAHKDWRALAGMRDAAIFADEIFGFHAQQVVEKTLKAWLALHGVEYPRTHDLSLLLSLLCTHEPEANTYADLLEFTPYAVQFRYAAFDEVGELLAREAVIERVSALLRQVENLLISAD